VGVAFGHRVVFDDLTCSFPHGCLSVIMGGSGSGKSTLLRLISGLQRPDAGEISVADDSVVSLNEDGLNRMRGRLGMLFQNGALLDSMTIFDNVALPLREHRQLSEREIADAVHRRLEAVGLSDVDGLLPASLSGGMLRRAALARAIIGDPEILLCDEPFSGLDPLNVSRIEALLGNLNRELGLTLLVSSHHVASSLRMADQLVLLIEGGAVSGEPQSLVRSEDQRVREFLGPEAAVLASAASDTALPPAELR
jgi:phospholipid/cholesterol/gamma-HCH transport system ATP-binding protein